MLAWATAHNGVYRSAAYMFGTPAECSSSADPLDVHIMQFDDTSVTSNVCAFIKQQVPWVGPYFARLAWLKYCYAHLIM